MIEGTAMGAISLLTISVPGDLRLHADKFHE